MSNNMKWLEEELERAEKAIEKLTSGMIGGSKPPEGPTEQEAQDLEYHYFKIAQTMRKILSSDRCRQD